MPRTLGIIQKSSFKKVDFPLELNNIAKKLSSWNKQAWTFCCLLYFGLLRVKTILKDSLILTLVLFPQRIFLVCISETCQQTVVIFWTNRVLVGGACLIIPQSKIKTNCLLFVWNFCTYTCLLTSNHIEQIGILLVFEKVTYCLFIPNCTRNHVITYTNRHLFSWVHSSRTKHIVLTPGTHPKSNLLVAPSE